MSTVIVAPTAFAAASTRSARARAAAAVDVEPEGGELDRDVRPAREVLRRERLEQRRVRDDGRVRAGVVADLLAQVVDRREQPVAGQAVDALERVVGGLTCDEPVDDPSGRADRLDAAADPGRPRRGEDGAAERVHPSSRAMCG